ncbi:unnamed protein product, partial [Tilletia laevis]
CRAFLSAAPPHQALNTERRTLCRASTLASCSATIQRYHSPARTAPSRGAHQGAPLRQNSR